MSILVIKVKEEGNVSPMKKFIKKIFGEKVIVLSDEEYRDSKFLQMMAEGRGTGTLTDEEAKKELKKRGIKI